MALAFHSCHGRLLLALLWFTCAATDACRQDPAIKLAGVPDLMRWSADGPTAKLGVALEKAVSPVEAVAVVAKFLLDTK
jgi:hypothetical protein